MLSSATPATKDDVKNDSVLVKDYFQQMETFLQSFGKKRFYKIFYYKLSTYLIKYTLSYFT